MDATKQKGKFVVRFELGIFGLFSLTVVVGCIFLWMFLLGVWAGQTVLQSSEEFKTTTGQATAPELEKLSPVADPPAPVASPKASQPASQEAEAPPANAEWETAEPSLPTTPPPDSSQEILPEKNKKPEKAAKEPILPTADTSEPSFFTIQVGAYRDAERAKNDAAQWRSKGHEVFSVVPNDGDDPFTRVYIGRFNSLNEANQSFARLEKEEKLKGYVALLPAQKTKKTEARTP